MVDWDAARYHRISDLQLGWGERVIERLAPRRGERILDLGCGTGRLTGQLAARPDVTVIGFDRSAAMLREAAGRRGDPAAGDTAATAVRYVRGDAAALPFTDAFHAVFSNATLHWVPDHDALFASIGAALKPGGRLVAQCGGHGNLRRLYGRARMLMAESALAPFYEGWRDPWRFEGAAATHARLAAAGFARIEVWLSDAPARFASAEAFAEFIGAVCLRHELDRLPEALRAPFLDHLTTLAAKDDPPYVLDYSRLNITARKPAS